jgi:hypothetical protein
MSRRTQGARPAYRWAVWFLVSVGVWNFLAAGVFGFLIKLPVVLTLEAWKIGELEHSATRANARPHGFETFGPSRFPA